MVGNRLGYPTYVLQAGAFLAGDDKILSVPDTKNGGRRSGAA